MSFIEWIGAATEEFHDVTDEEALRQLENATATDYRRYLAQMYGFVCPLERALAATPGMSRYLDPRTLHKHELLRRDLSALRMPAEQIDGIPQCAIPSFARPEEAIGWLYPLERSTLRHGDLFRHLAAILPGEAAFASSYLKCHFGAVGETWRELGRVLDAFEHPAWRADAVLSGARASFRCLHAWRFLRTIRRPSGKSAQPSPRAHAASERRRALAGGRP